MLRALLQLALLAALSPLSARGMQEGQDQKPPQPQPAQQQQPPAAPTPQPPPVSPQESSSAKPEYGDEAPSTPAAPTGSSPSAKSGKPGGTDPDAPHVRPPDKPGVLPPEDSPAWDPFHAEQDIEVGTFYLHKGDTDAAIARFEDAIRLRPNFAKPRMLLAEIYEKRGDKASALQYYKEYLKVFPDAPDSAKVKKKIEKLSQ